MSKLEEMETLAYQIIEKYDKELTGLKRKNSLIVLSSRFDTLKKCCLESSEKYDKK